MIHLSDGIPPFCQSLSYRFVCRIELVMQRDLVPYCLFERSEKSLAYANIPEDSSLRSE